MAEHFNHIKPVTPVRQKIFLNSQTCILFQTKSTTHPNTPL